MSDDDQEDHDYASSDDMSDSEPIPDIGSHARARKAGRNQRRPFMSRVCYVNELSYTNTSVHQLHSVFCTKAQKVIMCFSGTFSEDNKEKISFWAEFADKFDVPNTLTMIF